MTSRTADIVLGTLMLAGVGFLFYAWAAILLLAMPL
jgi:hypothetical protein